MRRTKIVCTIGPASRDPELLYLLIKAGMDVARLNFSHGSHAEHGENIARIRAAAERADVPVAILADLQGPKLRMGEMVDPGVVLESGQEVILTTAPIVGRDPSALPVQYKSMPDLLETGDALLIDDGLLELRVLSTTGTEIRARVVTGGLLKSNKGINLPGATPDLPSITVKDRQDLAFALAHGIDMVALSFVRSAADVQALKDLIHDLDPLAVSLPVMPKIEKPAALDNITEIIEVSDAVMVARGDLGIELSAAEVPLAQKRIICLCNQAGVPVITATQMLDSMIRNPLPTRAEASDVANAILDGTDAVMLSGETSVGVYPLLAVQTMARIAQEVDNHRSDPWLLPAAHRSLPTSLSIADAVTLAAHNTAQAIDAAAIVTPTVSGYTARKMSSHRPRSPIIAVTPSPIVQRQLMLYWGVTPLLAPRTDNTDQMLARAVEVSREHGLVKAGDKLVLTAGAAGSSPGTTNLIRILVVEP